jgi:branched-chain amino acid transport system substrate-binding protein
VTKSFGLGKSKKLVLVLTAMMVLSLLAGCGGSSGDQSSGESGEKVVKIGVLGPFTGPCARTGDEFKGATQMAFEEINYKVGDYKVELVWIDDESDPEKAVRAYEQAVVKDKIDAGLGNWNSEVSVSVMDVAAKYQIPHFFAFGATEVVNEKYNTDKEKYSYWVGKGWPTASLLSIAYVNTLDEAIQKGIWKPENKKAAVYAVDNDWGRSFGDAIEKQLEDAGWEVTGQSFVAKGETECYPLLKKLKDQGNSLLVGTMVDPSSVSAFIKQAREVGVKSMIVCDGLGWVGEWYNLTGNASDYVIDQIPQWTTPEAKKFKEDFTAKNGFEPSPSGAGLNYDWTRFMIKVLQDTYDTYGEINKETLYKTAKEKVMTGQLTFTDGIIMEEYKFTPESFPDPVVGKGHYIFPVIQYFDGKGTIVWPDEWKEADIKIPAEIQ